MSAHSEHPVAVAENLKLGQSGLRWSNTALVVGGVGLAAALGLGLLAEAGIRRFLFSYLIGFAFFLSIALGGLLFVMVQHLTRAGWSVSLRRLAEVLASTMPVIAVLSLPLIIAVVAHNGVLYPWAGPEAHHDHLIHQKTAFLNPWFWTARMVIYFVIWSWLSVYYWRRSTEQDASGRAELTTKMEARSGWAILLTVVTLTAASFDLLMSLDAHWYSTIFGVYYFAGCAAGIFASMIVVAAILQRLGYLEHSLTREHYHDLGKFLFAFVFFWGYIAFSQYMLIRYAHIPEERGWLVRRGMSTAGSAWDLRQWSPVALSLLFGHLLIPFAGLLSRTVKRNRGLLAFWAVWVLVFHWMDIWWLVMPELDGGFHFGLVDIAATIGVGGIFLAAALRRAAGVALRPTQDPRLGEALAFENL